MRPYSFEICPFCGQFHFSKSGIWSVFEKFLSLYGRFGQLLAKKSGLLAKSADQKWAEKLRGIFSKRHFFGLFYPFFWRFATIYL